MKKQQECGGGSCGCNDEPIVDLVMEETGCCGEGACMDYAREQGQCCGRSLCADENDKKQKVADAVDTGGGCCGGGCS